MSYQHSNRHPMSEVFQSDPRRYQVFALSALVGIGVYFLELPIHWQTALVVIVVALLAERVFTEDRFDPWSALISALSLCLLLRTHNLALAGAAAAIAITSKQLLRVNGKHLFNPSALALVLIASGFDAAWISPGQWGRSAYLLVMVAAFGSIVVARATRLDTTLAFLSTFAALCLVRAFYLGDPLSIPLHQLSNGALLIFAFFMISDPRTTPARRAGRVLFAALVACGAAFIEFVLYRANGPLYALVITAPLVPLIDRYFFTDRSTPQHAEHPTDLDHFVGEHHVTS